MKVETGIEEAQDVEAWVEMMIARHGYAQISHYDPGAGLPGLAFTIGLEASRGIPELMVMGVAPHDAAQLFSVCIEGHDAGRCCLGPEAQIVAGLIEGFSLALRPMGAPMVAQANGLRPARQGNITRLTQLLLPDNGGHFPGEFRCDPQIAAAQDPDRLIAPAVVN